MKKKLTLALVMVLVVCLAMPVMAFAADSETCDFGYLYLEQNTRGETLYFCGDMDGYYFKTTTNRDEATTVYFENVEGGFHMFFYKDGVKTYLDTYDRGSGKAGVQLSTTPGCVYFFDAELDVISAMIDGAQFYLGTYNNYNTISASKISFINAENKGVSQFPAQVEYAVGSMSSPIFCMSADFTTEIPADTAYWHSIFGVGGTTLTVTGENAYIIYNGEKYEAADGVVSVEIPDGGIMGGRMPTLFAVGNNGSETASYYVEFVYPVGHSSNPEPVYDLSNIVLNQQEGDIDGHYFSYYNFMAQGTLTLTLASAPEGSNYTVIATNNSTGSMYWMSDSENNDTIEMPINPWDQIIIQMGIGSDAAGNWYPAGELVLSGEITAPVGTRDNPEVIDSLDQISCSISEGNNQGYFYSYTSENAGTISLALGSITEGVEYDMTITNMSTYVTAWLVDSLDGTLKMDVEAGDTVIVQVNVIPDENYNYPAADIVLVGEVTTSLPLGTEENPLVVENALDLYSVEVAAGESVYYAISSMLNGKVLKIGAVDGMTVTLNGTPVIPVDGVYEVELTGAPTNRLVVTNSGEAVVEAWAEIADPAGTESNPIFVMDPAELYSIDVAAGESVYYAISSMLYGQVLTIAAEEGLSIQFNGVVVEAVDGLYTIELTGGPTAQLVATNCGETDIEAAANINYPLGTEYNPYFIMSTDVEGVQVAGNSDLYVNIAAMLNGNYLIVEAVEGLTVTVNGVVLETETDVYCVELTGAPTNRVVFTNTTGELIDAGMMFSANPANTGDNGMVIYCAIAALLALAGLVVVMSKKRAF